MEITFPQVFVDKNFKYDEKYKKECAHADGLMGWALCMSGNKPPENFGYGMIQIGSILGIPALPENLMELNKEVE